MMDVVSRYDRRIHGRKTGKIQREMEVTEREIGEQIHESTVEVVLSEDDLRG